MDSVSKQVPELFARAVEANRQRVSALRPEQWQDPTPCDEWDMRALVNHLAGENRWIAAMFSGKIIEEVGNSLDGDLLGDDPTRAFTQSAEAARAAVSSTAALDVTYRLSFGEFSGWEYATQLFLDHTVHGWDIAKGAGQEATLDPELVEASIPVAEEIVGFVGEGSVYGYRQPVGPNAPLQEALLAIVGRGESWTPPARS